MENKRGCIFSFKAAQKGDGLQIAKKKMGLRHASFHVCCASKQREEEGCFTFWRSIPKKNNTERNTVREPLGREFTAGLALALNMC